MPVGAPFYASAARQSQRQTRGSLLVGVRSLLPTSLHLPPLRWSHTASPSTVPSGRLRQYSRPRSPLSPASQHLARAHGAVGPTQTSLAHRARLVLSPKCLQDWRGFRGAGGTGEDSPWTRSARIHSRFIERRVPSRARAPIIHGVKSRTPRQGCWGQMHVPILSMPGLICQTGRGMHVG